MKPLSAKVQAFVTGAIPPDSQHGALCSGGVECAVHEAIESLSRGRNRRGRSRQTKAVLQDHHVGLRRPTVNAVAPDERASSRQTKAIRLSAKDTAARRAVTRRSAGER